MGVRQYAAWCERRLAATVVAEGLHVGLLGVVQGPLTLTYRVRLMQPTRGALQRLLALGPALAAAVQAPAVRVQQVAGAVLIELPLPPAAHRTPTAAELAAQSQGLSVCVGLDAMRRPVHVDLRQHGALFWIGPSRRGKTQSMKSTLFALARQGGHRLLYAILSQKRADWASFEPAAGCLGLVSNPGEALAVLGWATELLRERAATGTGGATFVIVCDDLLNLLAAEPDLAGPLSEIASMGAGLGVHLLAGTQEGGSKRGTGGAGVENNATARLLYRSSSAAAGARAAGQAAAGLEALSGAKGDALLLLDGEGVRVATGHCEDREVLLLPAGGRLRAPWAAERPRTAQNGQNGPKRAVLAPTEGAHGGAGEGGVAERVLERSGLPLPGNRPPTASERALLRSLFAELGSKEKVYKAAWGFKNGNTFAWLAEALAEPDAEGATIDLSTETGKAAMQALLASKQIDWRATVDQLERERLN